jgi:hypothetical protein
MTQEAIKTRKQAKMLLVLISTTKTVDFLCQMIPFDEGSLY